MYKPETSYEEFLEKELEKYPGLNVKDIDELTERAKSNRDLPPVPAKMIVMFLHASYFNVDKAYKTIVSHYKYRKEMPQLFENFDPTEENMKKAFDCVTLCQLTDSQTGKEKRFVYGDLKNNDPQAYDYVQHMRLCLMVIDHLIMTAGTFDGLIVVLNAKGMSWRHIVKTPMNLVKKFLYYVQEGLPFRLKEVHVLNAGYMVTMLFNIIRPFMTNGLMDLIQIHSEGSTEIFDFVDIEILPSEVGGNGKSHFELSDKEYQQIIAVRDWYLSSSN